MDATKAVRKRLRRMINDIIPKDGSDEDADFSDEELNEIIDESTNVYYAASEIWTLKAGMLQGDIESYSAGNEKYDLTSLKDQLSFFLSMASKYKDKSDERDVEEEAQGSVMLKFKPPKVM